MLKGNLKKFAIAALIGISMITAAGCGSSGSGSSGSSAATSSSSSGKKALKGGKKTSIYQLYLDAGAGQLSGDGVHTQYNTDMANQAKGLAYQFTHAGSAKESHELMAKLGNKVPKGSYFDLNRIKMEKQGRAIRNETKDYPFSGAYIAAEETKDKNGNKYTEYTYLDTLTAPTEVEIYQYIPDGGKYGDANANNLKRVYPRPIYTSVTPSTGQNKTNVIYPLTFIYVQQSGWPILDQLSYPSVMATAAEDDDSYYVWIATPLHINNKNGKAVLVIASPADIASGLMTKTFPIPNMDITSELMIGMNTYMSRYGGYKQVFNKPKSNT